jgi:hypothetical protein
LLDPDRRPAQASLLPQAELAAATFRPQSVGWNQQMAQVPSCEQSGLVDPLQCIVLRSVAAMARTEQAADTATGQRIAGRVVSADGYGIPGVTLIASRVGAVSAERGKVDSSTARPQAYARLRAVSGVNGAYSFDGLADGVYMIRSNKHDNYASLRITVRSGSDYADLILVEEN